MGPTSSPTCCTDSAPAQPSEWNQARRRSTLYGKCLRYSGEFSARDRRVVNPLPAAEARLARPLLSLGPSLAEAFYELIDSVALVKSSVVGIH